MRVAVVIAVLAACSHETRIHDLASCETGSGDCEYGCRRGYNPPTDAGTCAIADPNSGNPPPFFCNGTFYTDGADPNHQGCCLRDGEGVLRFRECCVVVQTDAGPGMNQPRFECPE